MSRSLLSAAGGVVGSDEEASRLLLDVASTPPMSGGEWHAQFTHTFFDPPTHITWTHSLKTEGSGPVAQPTPFPSPPRRNLWESSIYELIIKMGRGGHAGIQSSGSLIVCERFTRNTR